MTAAILRHQRLLFAIATLAGITHAVDEVFFAEEAYRAIPVAVLSTGVAALWPRVPPLWRGASSLVFGVFWLGGVITHWIPAIDDGPADGDYTSLVSVPGGIGFLLLGATILRQPRSSQAPDTR